MLSCLVPAWGPSATLWSLLQPGDEILVDLTLYGCTFAFLTHGMARFGVQVRHVDMTNPRPWPTPWAADQGGVLRDRPPTPTCAWWISPPSAP